MLPMALTQFYAVDNVVRYSSLQELVTARGNSYNAKVELSRRFLTQIQEHYKLTKS